MSASSASITRWVLSRGRPSRPSAVSRSSSRRASAGRSAWTSRAVKAQRRATMPGWALDIAPRGASSSNRRPCSSRMTMRVAVEASSDTDPRTRRPISADSAMPCSASSKRPSPTARIALCRGWKTMARGWRRVLAMCSTRAISWSTAATSPASSSTEMRQLRTTISISLSPRRRLSSSSSTLSPSCSVIESGPQPASSARPRTYSSVSAEARSS